MNLAPVFRQRFFDSNGLPLASGLLYSYAAGTTTPQATYSNATGTANTNPVVLDSQGYADVWLDPSLSYKFVLKDSGGVQQWIEDSVQVPSTSLAWVSTQVYSAGDIVKDASGAGLLYVSLTNNNVGNALTNVSAWRVFGGNVRSVSTNATLAVTDDLVRSNSTSGNLTHTLPTISTTPTGKKIWIEDIGSGGFATTIKGSGTDTIEGNNTYASTLSQYDSVVMCNNGASWEAQYHIAGGVVTTAKIAALAVTAAKIANATITATQIANATITGTQVASSVNLPGNAVQENGRNVVVSGGNASTSLAVIRGTIDATFNIVSGEGFTVTSPGTGQATISFTNAFASAPSVTAVTQDTGGNSFANLIGSATTTQCFIGCWAGFGTRTSVQFEFIAIGPR